MQMKEAEAESLTRQLQGLQSRCQAIKDQQRDIDEAEEAQGTIEDIESLITKDEEELKLYSAVARLWGSGNSRAMAKEWCSYVTNTRRI